MLSNSKANDLFGDLDDDIIPSLEEIGVAIFITDQNHEAQRRKGCTPGHVVSVYRLKGKKPVKVLETMWNATRVQAERAADEYAREYLTRHVCGWR